MNKRMLFIFKGKAKDLVLAIQKEIENERNLERYWRIRKQIPSLEYSAKLEVLIITIHTLLKNWNQKKIDMAIMK